eukprot:146531_1
MASLNSTETIDKQVNYTSSNNRFVLFPIKNNDIWSMYKRHISNFWTTEQVNLSNELQDWNKLYQNEKDFIKNILAFFVSFNGIILDNVSLNFINEVELPEARCFYAFQSAMANIHSEMYSLLIHMYTQSEQEKRELFNEITMIDGIKQKAEYALKWANKDTPFIQRLVAFVCVEGIFFSGSFCALLWLKKRGLMPGLLYKLCANKLDNEILIRIVKDAVKCEKTFICDSVPVYLIGLNSNLMAQYIQFVADQLCRALGHQKIYNTPNPFDWMETIYLQSGTTDVLQKRVIEYGKAGIMSNLTYSSKDTVTDADFLI